MHGPSTPTVGHWVSLKGLSSLHPLIFPQWKTRADQGIKGGRQDVCGEARGKCNTGRCVLEGCFKEKLIEFEMPRVEQIYQVWHVCAQLKSNKDEGHLR